MGVRFGELGPGREERVVQAGGAEHPLVDDLAELLTGDLLDHQAEQDEVGVGVLELGVRLEGVLVLHAVREHAARGERAVRIAQQVVHEVRVGGVREQAAAHPGELAQRDPVAVAHAGNVGGDRVVQPDEFVVDEFEERGDRERLGLTADPDPGVGRHRLTGGRVGDAARVDVTPLPRQPQPDDDPGDAGLLADVLDGPVQLGGQLGTETAGRTVVPAVRAASVALPVLPVLADLAVLIEARGVDRRGGSQGHRGQYGRREQHRGVQTSGGGASHRGCLFRAGREGSDGNDTTRPPGSALHPGRAQRSPLVRSRAAQGSP